MASPSSSDPGELPIIITQMEDVLIARKDSYKRAVYRRIGRKNLSGPMARRHSLIIHEVPTPALVETIASSAEVLPSTQERNAGSG